MSVYVVLRRETSNVLTAEQNSWDVHVSGVAEKPCSDMWYW